MAEACEYRLFEPVNIGILIDMDLHQLLADRVNPTVLAMPSNQSPLP